MISIVKSAQLTQGQSAKLEKKSQDPVPDLISTFLQARGKLQEYVASRKGEVFPDVGENLERLIIQAEDSLASWINRNRPEGVPEITGEPYCCEHDKAWIWESNHWSVFLRPHESGLLDVTWAKLGSCFWYVLGPWGDREIEGFDWDFAA